MGRSSVRGELPLALYLAVVAIALLQVVVLDVGNGEVVRPVRSALPALAAAGVLVLGRVVRAGEGPAGRRWLRGVAAVLAGSGVWAVQAFVRALLEVGEGPSSFYRVKVLVTTPLGDHNTAAGLLLVGVVATVVLACEDRRWWGGVAATSLGVVACLSRGAAAVLLIVALGSWAVGTRRAVARRLTVAAFGILAAVVALAAILGSAAPSEGGAEGGAEDAVSQPAADGVVGASVIARADLVVRGFALTAEHPGLGVGLGAFGDYADDLPPPNHHAHNALAHAGAEGGLPMLFVQLALPLVLLVRAWRLPRGWRREVTLLGGLALVAHSQIDILAGLLGAELLLAALLALTAPEPATSPSVGEVAATRTRER